jgi:hypothetical protein
MTEPKPVAGPPDMTSQLDTAVRSAVLRRLAHRPDLAAADREAVAQAVAVAVARRMREVDEERP